MDFWIHVKYKINKICLNVCLYYLFKITVVYITAYTNKLNKRLRVVHDIFSILAYINVT